MVAACPLCSGGGVELRLAEDGEILLQSGHVFAGHYKEPDLTRQPVDADGWLHSGDIGRLDADGVLTIVGLAAFTVVSWAVRSRSVGANRSATATV